VVVVVVPPVTVVVVVLVDGGGDGPGVLLRIGLERVSLERGELVVA
jgi:hypothetical protein